MDRARASSSHAVSSGAPLPAERQSLNSLQVLRAFAAMLVVVGHLFGEAEQLFGTKYDPTGFPWGSGVDLFFVISGFVMVYTNHTAFGRPDAWKVFALKRIIRIVPLYYLFTSLMIVIVLVLPHQLHTAKFDAWQFVTSYLFWPYARYDGGIRPILSLGWTLNYEMFFYFLFSVFMFLRIGLAMRAIIGSLIALALMGYLLDPEITVLSFWTNSIILEFAFGVLAGLIFLKLGKIKTGWLIWCGAFAVAIASFFLLRAIPKELLDLPRFILWGVPAFLLVLSAVVMLPDVIDRTLPTWLILAGDSSYALYLCHPFVFGIVGIVWKKLGLVSDGYGVIFIVSTFALSFLASIAVHLLIENQLLAWLRHRFMPTRP